MLPMTDLTEPTVCSRAWPMMTRRDFGGFAGKLGNPLAIIEHGVVVKRYPSCGCTQRIMDGVEDLRTEYGFTADDVVSVTGRLPAEYMAVLQYERPENAAQARFCVEYCVAAQLVDGALSPVHFLPDSLRREDLVAMMPRITKAELCQADGPTYSAVGLADEIVEIVLKDRRALRIVVRDPVGAPTRPMSPAAFEAKARLCFSGALQDTDQDAVIALCGDLMRCDQIGELMRPGGLTNGKSRRSSRTTALTNRWNFRRGLFAAALALSALARQLACTAHGFSALTLLLLRGFLEVAAQLHFTVNAFTLQLLFQRAKSLVDIVVAYGDLDDGPSP